MVKTPDDYEKSKNIRIPNDEEWAPFEAATRAMHPTGRSPRTAVIREFIRWYMRRPGAVLPKRPDAGPWSALPAVEHSPPAAEPEPAIEPEPDVEPEPQAAPEVIPPPAALSSFPLSAVPSSVDPRLAMLPIGRVLELDQFLGRNDHEWHAEAIRGVRAEWKPFKAITAALDDGKFTEADVFGQSPAE
jgi:hypothetical protein